ncbi:MAG: DNA primase [Candidatus Niyogibacteria bacterium CG10_big_fil_rev_8_21_14_0_10_46_36]|uniref:DNA primase n=1 Tax=Candidatus Niyogibacteria bacterium CG10_big_fil_rev_8_21_14_0_10_46_36 TaxID=1974726 RepID=A0A2H0TCF8_9BACT|nr:MAG: DNA primase [Candidatus Niyogibacteria bacterium CG10_big_fil_rev_8_21_14_0_10_46_36]
MSSPVEQIKERLDIVELVRSYVKLDKAGANFKALCPFHSEKTPSFFVSPAKQMWHCFSCSKGGDHFQFIQDLEGVEFPEALRILAERAGVELKREDPRARSERTRLLSLVDDAARFYESNLVRRKDVGDYLKGRGLTGETAKRFRIGYAEREWNTLCDYLKRKGYREDEIEKVGLAVKKDGGGHFDRFRARIMFPLFDGSGRIVGFSGRIFDKDAEGQKDADSKYINSPQTILYDKSKVLYGLSHAKDAIRKEEKAILVEGQMDAVLSHQAGVEHAIAVSGTALTQFHLATLKRFAQSLLVSFDRDAAGLNAADRSIKHALAEGFDVSVISLPPGKDPADIVKESADAWRESIQHPIPFIAFLMDAFSEQEKDGRALLRTVKERVLPYIVSMESEMERAYWVKDIARRLSLAEDAVWKEMDKTPRTTDAAPKQLKEPERRASSRKDSIEERILGILAWKKDMPQATLEKLNAGWFSSERREFAEHALAGKEAQSSHYIKKLALEAELAYEDDLQAHAEFEELTSGLKKEHIRAELETLASDMRRAEGQGDVGLLEKKMEEFKRLSQELHEE